MTPDFQESFSQFSDENRKTSFNDGKFSRVLDPLAHPKKKETPIKKFNFQRIKKKIFIANNEQIKRKKMEY
jgi:hypothetical protein